MESLRAEAISGGVELLSQLLVSPRTTVERREGVVGHSSPCSWVSSGVDRLSAAGHLISAKPSPRSPENYLLQLSKMVSTDREVKRCRWALAVFQLV